MSKSDSSESDDQLKHISMLTKDQETILESIKHISDPKLQKEFLDKLLKSLEDKPETSSASQNNLPSTPKNSYNLTTILDKGKKSKHPVGTLQDLYTEIKKVNTELKELKAK